MPAPKGNKNAVGNKGGTPGEYYKFFKEGTNEFTPKFKKRVLNLCLLMANNLEIATILEVSEATFYRWINEHVEFRELLSKGREEADAQVSASLYRRAKGYKHKDVHISNYKGEIRETPIIKHYPPDTRAAEVWLNRRQRSRWGEEKKSDDTDNEDDNEIKLTFVPPTG